MINYGPLASGLPAPAQALVSYIPGDILSSATYTGPTAEPYTDINGVAQTTPAVNTPRDGNYIAGVRTLLLGTSDTFTIPWSATPVPMTVYVRVIDQGFTAAAATSPVVVCSVGNGNNRFTLQATASGYQLNYRVAGVDHLATDNTALAVSGDVLEFRATLSATGAVTLSHTKNNGPESTAVGLTGATTLGQDSFTRANSTTTLGTATTGGAWTSLTVLAGISNNRGYWVSDRAGGNVAWVTTASLADTVAVDCVTSNIKYYSTGPLIRYVDTNNYLRVTFNNGVALLESRVSGTTTTRGSYTTTLPTIGASTFTATATVLSNVVTCYVNGVQVGTPYTLAAGEITAYGSSLNCGAAGNPGGTVGAGGANFDNFLATSGSNTVALPAAWDSANIEIGSLSGLEQGAMGIVALIVVGGTLLMQRARSAVKKAIPAGADTTPANIVMSPQNLALTLGGADATMSSVVTNAAGSVLSSSVAPVTYTSDTPAVATVGSSSGIVHAVSVGVATLTGSTANGKFDTSPVTVQADTTPASVTISPNSMTLTTGGGDSGFSATVRNAAGTTIANAPVTYSSGNNAVLTVTSSTIGTVHPVAAGTTTVTVTTSNGLTATATVTVTTGTNANPVVPPAGTYQSFSYHWPHKRQQWTDFGYHYRPIPPETLQAVKIDQALKASRIDQIMGGTRSSWTQYNPTVVQGAYMVLSFATMGANNQEVSFGGTVSSPAGSDATTWCAANGAVDPEGLFLHYYSGQTKFNTAKTVSAITVLSPATLTVTAHGYTNGQQIEIMQTSGLPNNDTTNKLSTGKTGGIPDGNYTWTTIDANTGSLNTTATSTLTAGSWANISNVLGDGTVTFANRKTVTDSFGTHWPCYFGASYAPNYHTARLANAWSTSDFLFGDVMDSTTYVGFNAPLNPPLSSKEYPCRGLNLTQTAAQTTQWQADFKAVVTAIRAANGNKRIQANISAYTFPTDDTMAKVCGAAQTEQYPAISSANTIPGYISRMASLTNAGAQIVIVDGPFYTDNPMRPYAPYNGTSHGYSSPTARWKSTFYAAYLLAVPVDPALLLYDDDNGRWTDNQATYYVKICEAMIGHPTGPATSVFVTVNGITDQVFTRVFDNGCVIGRYPADYTLGRWSDADATTSNLPTPPAGYAYYRVWDDASVDINPSTTVSLDRIDAGVFILQTTGIQAKRSDTFVDSIGTNIHMDAAPYNAHFPDWVIPAMRTLGMRKVRSGSFGSGADPSIAETTLLASEAGTAFTLVTNQGSSYTDMSIQDYMLTHIGDVSTIDCLEGPNEVDNNNAAWGGDPGYFANVTSFMGALKTDRDTNANATVRTIPISTASVTSAYGASHGGNTLDLSSYAAFGTVHPYPLNGQEPGSQLAADVANVKPVFASLTNYIVTETGYQTAPNATTPSYEIGQGVTEAVQAKYLPRLWAEYFKQGVTRTFNYELFDDGIDLTNGESNFGLFRADNTQKPVVASIANLITILGEKTWTPPAAVQGAAYVDDTFVRANGAGWGVATSGSDTNKTWTDGDGAEAANWSIASNQGVALNSSQIRNICGDSHTGDVEYLVKVRNLKANYSNLVRFYGRWVDLTHNYSVDFNPGVVSQFSINKNGSTSLASLAATKYQTMTNPNIRFRIRTIGSDVYLYARAWDSAGTEPTTWDLATVDKAPGAGYLAGSFAVWADNNSSGQQMKFSGITAWPITVTPGSYSALGTLTPGRLDYTLTGATTNLQDLLLQKSDGSFWLVLWNRVQCWNQGTKQAITNAAVSVTIATAATHTWSTYTPSVGTSPTVVGIGTTSVTINVPDEIMIVKVA